MKPPPPQENLDHEHRGQHARLRDATLAVQPGVSGWSSSPITVRRGERQ